MIPRFKNSWILSQPDKGLYYYLKYGEKEMMKDIKILPGFVNIFKNKADGCNTK